MHVCMITEAFSYLPDKTKTIHQDVLTELLMTLAVQMKSLVLLKSVAITFAYNYTVGLS